MEDYAAMMSRALKRKFEDIAFLRKNSQDVKIGFFKKLKMWTSGFVSEAYILHSLGENDPSDYVCDLVRLKKACKFNGYYSIVLYDKLYFSRMLSAFSEHLPVIYGLLRKDCFHRIGSPGSEQVEAVLDVCKREGSVMIKPIVGTRGEGINMLSKNNDEWVLNGKVVSQSYVLSHLSKLEDYLVTEFVHQHSYAAKVYAASANTIRVLTLWDDDEQGAFIAVAVHRFGTEASAPTDNWTLGGLSAMVDVQSGRLGKALSYPQAGRFTQLERHPETNRRIEDIAVPRWDAIKSRITEMAATLPFVPYIGWDIIVTEQGFKVIEGNNCPGINLLQVHYPLLKNARIRKFYEKRVAIVEAQGDGKRYHKLPFRI